MSVSEPSAFPGGDTEAIALNLGILQDRQSEAHQEVPDLDDDLDTLILLPPSKAIGQSSRFDYVIPLSPYSEDSSDCVSRMPLHELPCQDEDELLGFSCRTSHTNQSDEQTLRWSVKNFCPVSDIPAIKKERISSASSVEHRITSAAPFIHPVENTRKNVHKIGQILRSNISPSTQQQTALNSIQPHEIPTMDIQTHLEHLNRPRNNIWSSDPEEPKQIIRPALTFVRTIKILLPIKTIESFFKFDKRIQKEERVRNALIERLNRIGGNDPQNCLERLMKAFSTLELQKSWAVNHKRMVGYNTTKIIFDAVRHHFPLVTNEKLEAFLDDWASGNPVLSN